MFDTMTMTKIVGSLCGALLIFLFLAWGSESLFHVGGGGHGEGDEAAYVIEVAAEETQGGVEGPNLLELLAAADTGKGQKLFSKCKACHKLENGKNGTGPHLFGVVGRTIAAVTDFKYSPALTGIRGVWDINQLDGFITAPKKFAPGTKMTYAGMKKAKDRANLIAYLQTIGN